MNIIPKFIPTIGNLPASYDESLSYLQQLMMFKKYLNDTINIVNQLTEIVSNIDINFDELNKRIDDLTNEQIALENRINSNVDAKLTQYYNQTVVLMNNYQRIFNSSLAQLQETLENEIERIELGDIKAYNPTTGTYENVSTVIMDVYETLRNDAVTCTEFDGLELTATEFDALEITAYNFDVNGKTFLNVA